MHPTTNCHSPAEKAQKHYSPIILIKINLHLLNKQHLNSMILHDLHACQQLTVSISTNENKISVTLFKFVYHEC